MFTYEFGMQETLAIAVALLLLGRWIKNQIPLLKRFFIPAPVIGGIVFSIFIAMKVFINIQKRFTAEEDEAKAKAEAEAAAAAAAKPDPQIELLTEIRDLMKNNAAK